MYQWGKALASSFVCVPVCFLTCFVTVPESQHYGQSGSKDIKYCLSKDGCCKPVNGKARESMYPMWCMQMTFGVALDLLGTEGF